MAYSLRLPPRLDAASRAHADYLGISINALICVALDAYVRGVSAPVEAPASASPVPPPEAFELVPQVIPSPDTRAKIVKEKEAFKARQRARDTAFR